jgi:spastin
VQYYIDTAVLKKYELLMNQEESLKKQEEMKDYKQIIEETIIDKSLNVKWDDLVGVDHVKQQIMETIILPTLNPKLFTGLRTPARGVLFYGPPGNGKTMIAKALASECGKDVSFLNVSSSTFSSKTLGRDTDKLIKALFSVANEKQPAVIFIDEMDSILSKRGAGESEESRRLKNEFLIQFEGVTSRAGERVVVIGATNRPFDIDDAILRRFSVHIHLELPNTVARKHAIAKLLQKVKSAVNDEGLNEVVRQTELFSYADLATLCREASFEPVREIPPEMLAKMSTNDIRSVTMHDFEKALKKVQHSVTSKTLEDLKNWSATKT